MTDKDGEETDESEPWKEERKRAGHGSRDDGLGRSRAGGERESEE